MLEIANLFLLGAYVFGDMNLLGDDRTVKVEPGQVAEVSFHREWWRDDSECSYRGILTTYERTWEETIKTGGSEMVLPPEPGKPIHVVVVNKRVCPGKEPEPMFSVSTHQFGAVCYKCTLHVSPVKSEADAPKWWPQVKERIIAAAETNPEAKAFWEFSQKASVAAQAKTDKVEVAAPALPPAAAPASTVVEVDVVTPQAPAAE